jgi:hypothetical protein
MNNTNDLRRYDYGDYTPLTSRCEQIKEYLDEKLDGMDSEHISTTIRDSVNENMDDIRCRLCHTNCHIENAKNEIIEKVEQGKSQCTAFHTETKEAIADAIDNINRHTDNKFDEIDFETKFSDLNEQIKSFNDLKLGEYSNE